MKASSKRAEAVIQRMFSEPRGPYRTMGEVLLERKHNPEYSADIILPPALPSKDPQNPRDGKRIVAMGLSMGGVEALEAVLPYLPVNTPPIVVVQHMPESQGDFFVRYINNHCELDVRKAQHGDGIPHGQVFIGTGDQQMVVGMRGGKYYVEMMDGVLVSLHPPSIDVLFRSVSYAGANGVGIIMTGYGKDGVDGLKEIYACGGYTIAQDDRSCIATGMPRAAIKSGAVKEVATLSRITEIISEMLSVVLQKGERQTLQLLYQINIPQSQFLSNTTDPNFLLKTSQLIITREAQKVYLRSIL